MRLWLGVIGVAGVLAVSSRVHAQVVGPVGGEFQVNTYTSGDQVNQAMCGTADGRFVVVWQGESDNNYETFAQRYSSAGTRLGTEFQVNTYTPGYEQIPSVCCDADGNFVVVWAQFDDQDGDDTGIFGQRFASDGTFAGTEFQVNTYTTGDQTNPAVCCSGTGDFVVTWGSRNQDGDYFGIFAQRFASNGMFLGKEFLVNTYTVDHQLNPALCCAADGDFVVAWKSNGQDGDEYGVFGQRFASDGTFAGTEFQVNTYATKNQSELALCCAADGDFVVAWQSRSQDGDTDGVFGQRFASNGMFEGAEFQVNTYTTSSQTNPALCCGDERDFVVAWQGEGQDGDGVFARRFADSGLALSGEVPVNSHTTSEQESPAVACNAEGGFVVTWEGYDQDGDLSGIFGQRFGLLPVSGTPALSWLGLAAAAIALLGSGVVSIRRRR